MQIENVGQVPIRLQNGQVYVRRIVPLDPIIRQEIEKGESPVDPQELRVNWPTIGDPYNIKTDFEISPGESEIHEYDLGCCRSPFRLVTLAVRWTPMRSALKLFRQRSPEMLRVAQRERYIARNHMTDTLVSWCER